MERKHQQSLSGLLIETIKAVRAKTKSGRYLEKVSLSFHFSVAKALMERKIQKRTETKSLLFNYCAITINAVFVVRIISFDVIINVKLNYFTK